MHIRKNEWHGYYMLSFTVLVKGSEEPLLVKIEYYVGHIYALCQSKYRNYNDCFAKSSRMVY